jgi:hypothetical protein
VSLFLEGLEPEPQDYMTWEQLFDMTDVGIAIAEMEDEPYIWGKVGPVEWEGSFTFNSEQVLKALGYDPSKKKLSHHTFIGIEHNGITYHFKDPKIMNDGDTLSIETGPITFMD